jgi:hypothetical protein
MKKMMKKFYDLKSRQLQKLMMMLAAAFMVSACATTPPPVEQMATARSAINNANSAGSSEFAPLQIKSATEKMAVAESAMKDKKYELARQQAEQAQIDAQLALDITRTAKAQKAAKALQEDNRVLRQEIDRKTK